jgi:AraC-like DNA-binding protein
VHILQSASVHPALRQYVRAYAQRELTPSGEEVVQPIPASLEHIVEFEFHKPPEIEYPDGTVAPVHRVAVVGPHTSPGINIRLKGRIVSFAIFFHPLGLWQLFRIPANELPNTSYRGGDLLGSSIDALWHRAAERTSFESRVVEVEKYLLERARRASGCTSTMLAASYIFEQQGVCRIDTIARQSGLSVRHFERRFGKEIGIKPKLFARIARFQMALDTKLHRPERSWLKISHDFGYHDQMHMIRDFQGLSGATPQRILVELGDIRPPALAASRNHAD